MDGGDLQAGNPEMGDQAYLVPGADPGSPTRGRECLEEVGLVSRPSAPSGAGLHHGLPAIFWRLPPTGDPRCGV